MRLSWWSLAGSALWCSRMPERSLSVEVALGLPALPLGDHGAICVMRQSHDALCKTEGERCECDSLFFRAAVV